MFSTILIVLFMSSPLTVWLFVIRRYCVRNGMGYTPGANWDTTMWIDWQEAKAMATLRGDLWMLRWCRVFLGINLFFLAAAFLAMAGRLAMM
jgi:hypothetical protein